MNTAASIPAIRRLPRRSSTPDGTPLGFTLMALSVIVPVTAFLGYSALTHWDELDSPLVLLVWLLIVAGADLMPVPHWGRVSLTMSLPVLLAAGMLFPPWVAALLAFVGSVDIRELRRSIPAVTALFNRSQIAASVLCASALFHVVGLSVGDWPRVLVPASLALFADASLNVAAVVLAGALKGRISARQALVGFGREGGWPFVLGYICYGLMALVLAATYERIGPWGLAAFVLPLVLSRQMFAQGQRLAEASRAAVAQSRILIQASERIAEERADERRRVAGALHDEVLPPLYKVHLMGEVLRRELETGRLLAMDDDLPELLRATDAAATGVRLLIGNLRRSPIGADGLASTIRLLLEEMSAETDAAFDRDIVEADASPLVQLLIYQVAREAVANAVRHSGATRIGLRLMEDGDYVRLVVEDDGKGFDTLAAGRLDDHFGLRLMHERAAAAGGVLHVDSQPGVGTRVVGRFPRDVRIGNE